MSPHSKFDIGNSTSSVPNRRAFRSSSALATTALSHLLSARDSSPLPAKAKRIIYLFQSGGPPQMDLFDPKPELDQFHGQEVPASIFNGQRKTGMTAGQTSFPVARSPFNFQQAGQSGQWLNSDLLPHLSKVADDISVIRSMHTEAINHDPAITFFQTGSSSRVGPRSALGSPMGLVARTPTSPLLSR